MRKILKCILIFIIIYSMVGVLPIHAQDPLICGKLFNNHGSIMFVIDSETGKIEDANQAAASFYGYSIQQLTTMYVQDFNTLSSTEVELERKAASREERNYFVFNHRISNGEIRTVEVYSYPYTDGDKVLLFSIIQDITSRIEAEEVLKTRSLLFITTLIIAILILIFIIIRLKKEVINHKKTKEEIIHISYHDELTGLYNRRFFEEELKRLDVERRLPLSIIVADVNGLKLVNDAFGHVMGDQLIIKVAEVIKKTFRSNDIVSRLGGDEFIILLPNTNSEETEKVVNRIKNFAGNTKLNSIQLSIALGWHTKNNENEDINQVFKKAEDCMYRNKLFESCSMRNKTIATIVNTLYKKDKREEIHSKEVGELAKRIAIAMNLSEREINELKTLGLLHDIGKITISENILNKQSKLTVDEWKEIKRHSEIGYNILRSASDIGDLAEYVLAHHENWDGTGYPKRLKGEEIPIYARIIRILDSYHAMISERPYRKAMTKEKAIQELKDNSGTQFDPQLVEIFVDRVLLKSNVGE